MSHFIVLFRYYVFIWFSGICIERVLDVIDIADFLLSIGIKMVHRNKELLCKAERLRSPSLWNMPRRSKCPIKKNMT